MARDEMGPANGAPASCCSSMSDALRWGLVTMNGPEHVLAGRAVIDMTGATMADVLTGEAVEADGWVITLALVFCPWCATRLVHPHPDWCEDPDGCTRPLCDCGP